MKAELERLLKQIEDEYNTAYNALLSVSEHDFIIVRMENVDRYRVELEKLVGEEEAIKLIVQRMRGEGHASRD